MNNCRTLNSVLAIMTAAVAMMALVRWWDNRLTYVIALLGIAWLVRVRQIGNWRSLASRYPHSNPEHEFADWGRQICAGQECDIDFMLVGNMKPGRVAVSRRNGTATVALSAHESRSSFSLQRGLLQGCMHVLHKDTTVACTVGSAVLAIACASHVAPDFIAGGTEHSVVAHVALGLVTLGIHIFMLASAFAYFSYLATDAKKQAIKNISVLGYGTVPQPTAA